MQDVTDTLTAPVTADAPPALSRYALLREAGRGGMSVVYEARDRHTGGTVAVKVLNTPMGLTPDQEEVLLSRFLREARAVAGLSHPNVIAIHEAAEEAGRHFLVMEFLRGETLRERLLRGPMAPDQADPVLRQVADALDAVHAQGVVHRDVKPSNVMLMLDGSAKLLDFGVARQSGDTPATGTGALVGSPAYMSPEQVRGGQGTPASDVWALGVLLYEMLAGQPPFGGKSIPTVLHQVTHEVPTPVPDVPEPIQRVLRRALEKDPSRRYPNARALADAFRAALPGAASVVERRRPLWPWALALVPVLLGLTLVILSRYRTSAPATLLALPPLPAAPAPAALPPARIAAVRPFPGRRAAPTAHPAARLRAARVKYRAAGHVSPSKPSAAAPAQARRTTRKTGHSHPRAWRAAHHRVRRAAASALPVFVRPRTSPVRRWDAWRSLPREPRWAFRLPPSPADAGRGPRPHSSQGDDDPSAASRLNRFIYSPEGTGM